MTAGLEAPFYKLMVSDLIVAEKIEVSSTPTPSLGDSKFKLRLTNDDVGYRRKRISTDIILSFVWVQGTIVSINLDEKGNSFKLNDGTGDVIVKEYERVPGGESPKIVKDSYVAVLGKLLEVPSPIVLKAIKIMRPMRQNPNIKTIWPLEVRELKATILEL